MVNPRSECYLRVETTHHSAPSAAGRDILQGNGYPGKILHLHRVCPLDRLVLLPTQIYMKKRTLIYMLQSLGAAMMPNGGSSMISVSSA